jgi:hypothetical protein
VSNFPNGEAIMSPDDNAPAILLAIFIPAAVVGTILGLAGIIAYTRQYMRSREIAADLILQMLNKKMSVEEIERVLLAWSQDPEFAKTMTKAQKMLGNAKPAPNFV